MKKEQPAGTKMKKPKKPDFAFPCECPNGKDCANRLEIYNLADGEVETKKGA